MVQDDERVGQGNLNDSFWGFVYMMKNEYLCSVIKRNVKPLKSKSYENYSRKVERVVCFEERRY